MIGGIIWFGTDDAATSYVTPIYSNTNEVPECFREGNGNMLEYSSTSSFWINNRIANDCYKAYNMMAPTSSGSQPRACATNQKPVCWVAIALSLV